MTKTTIEILKDAKALIETRGWTQHDYAKDAEGQSCDPTDSRATCFCAWGALQAAGASASVVAPSYTALRDRTAYLTVPGFNDAFDRTVEEVLAKFDEVIAAEEAKQPAA